LYNFILFIDKVSSWVGKAFAWSILVMTFGVGYEVFARYLMNAPTPWAFDISYMMYGALFMMAGAYTLSRDGHVRADLFYRKFPPRVQAGLEAFLYLIFFFPGILAFMITGYEYANDSLRYRELSINSPANVPIFQFKYIIPLAGTLLFAQGIAQVCRCILCLRNGQWPGLLQDVEETESVLMHAKEDLRDQQALPGAPKQ
jgi:TRAP-type mannitol/chloroaromatic compound transport system permease small subunit